MKKDSKLLTRVMHISFPNLIWINLTGNNLGTIECLSRIHFRILEGIGLGRNRLTSISSLRKCHWPNFKTIWLCKYFFIETEIKFKICLSCHKLSSQKKLIIFSLSLINVKHRELLTSD